MNRTLLWSSALLWLAAPLLAFLSWHRPFTESVGRAARMPARIGEFALVEDDRLTPRELQLLGTDDAVARTYRGDQDRVFVVALFHQHNWKSVHPPHLCLRGSDMVIDVDGRGEAVPLAGGGELVPGRIVATSRDGGRRYLCLYAFGAAALRTGSYWEFVLHHFPRAILRRDSPGFLLRVEAWLDEGDAEARCRAFLSAAVPALEALLDG